MPGESGGNVIIRCRELINGQRWTICSQGGDGGDGQDGTDGNQGAHGKDGRKMTRSEFEEQFHLPSKWDGNTSVGENRKKLLLSIERLVKAEGERSVDRKDDGSSFFIDGPTANGGHITASFFWGYVRRHAIILIKGKI